MEMREGSRVGGSPRRGQARHLVSCLRRLLPVELGHDARMRRQVRRRMSFDKLRQQQDPSSLEVRRGARMDFQARSCSKKALVSNLFSGRI